MVNIISLQSNEVLGAVEKEAPIGIAVAVCRIRCEIQLA